jgi:Thioredoxin-like
MYPHERSLVKKLEGKPFALLGINSDKDREELKDVLKTEQLTWRSWWDGGSTNGPIASKWNVRGWPTIYVLDHRGVIRGKQLRGASLEKLVDELVKEAEAKGANN